MNVHEFIILRSLNLHGPLTAGECAADVSSWLRVGSPFSHQWASARLQSLERRGYVGRQWRSGSFDITRKGRVKIHG